MTKFAFSFIAGIVAFNFFPYFPFSIITLSIAVMVCLLFRYREEKRRIFLMMSFFAFSILYSAARQAELPEFSVLDSDISIRGTITGVVEKGDEKLHLTLNRVFIEDRKVHGKIRLVVFQEFPEYRLMEPLLAPGVRISAVARLKEPHMLRNPGVYAYDLKKDGFAAAGYIKYMQPAGKSGGPAEWIHEKRRELGMILDSSLSPESAALHRAIVPGLKRGISTEMRDAFSAAGLAHILSISGTHFGLLAFIMFRSTKTAVLLLPERILVKKTLYITPTQIAAIVTVPVLVLYTLISGAGTPAVRSFIMVGIYMIAVFLGRKDQWLNSLSIAAVIILLWKPGALFELSFQLSFLAVLSIGLVLGQRQKSMMQPAQARDYRLAIFERLKAAMMMTVAAVIGTAPLVVLYFKQFPVISPVTNLLITPLICFVVLPLGFFTSFVALISGLHTMPLGAATDWITHFALKLIKLFSDVPYADLHMHNPSFVMIVLYYCSLVFMMGYSRLKMHLRFLPFILVMCIYMLSPYLSDNSTSVTFLDVGQGDASVVKLPDKTIMLIDGGTREPDMGRRVIAPYLWGKGIRRIDYLVLSHPHSDHFGGLIYIMDKFDIGEIWLNGRRVSESELFFQKIKEKNIPYRSLRRGDVLEEGGFNVHVLHPYDGFHAYSPRGEVSSQNSDSLVLRVEADNLSVLFTGDIEIEAEADLVHLGRWLESDIVKVPHHGSSTSSSGEFIRAVNPGTAVVSAGRHNPFSHPHKETLDRYRDAGVRILRTDRDGAATVISRGDTYEVKTYGDSRFVEVEGWRDEMRNLGLLKH